MRLQKKRTRRKLWKQKECNNTGCTGGEKCNKSGGGGGCGCGGTNYLTGGDNLSFAKYPYAYTPPSTLIPLNKQMIDLETGQGVGPENTMLINKNMTPISNYTSRNMQNGGRSGSGSRKTIKRRSKKSRKRRRYKKGGGFLMDGATNFVRVTGNNVQNLYNGMTGRPQDVSPLPFKDQLTKYPVV